MERVALPMLEKLCFDHVELRCDDRVSKSLAEVLTEAILFAFTIDEAVHVLGFPSADSRYVVNPTAIRYWIGEQALKKGA